MRGPVGRGAITVVGLIALCAASLAGCSASETVSGSGDEEPVVETPEPGGRVVFGLEADPNGLDPTVNAWDNAGIQLANAIFDPVVTFDAEGQWQPYLAESLTPSGDFKTWTVKLRPGVRFSDGDPLDADAAVTFFEKLRTSLITGPPAQMLDTITAVDELTVQVTTKRPWATLPALVSGQGGYIASPKQLADPEGHSHPIGTGPFKLRSWEQNSRFELVRNQLYWRAGLPYLDAVDFVVVPDGRQRVEMLGRGDLDVTHVSAPWELQRLDEVTEASALGSTPVNVERDQGDAEKAVVAFNTTKPPLDDVRVRQAIAYATDIRAIAEKNRWDLDRLAQGPLDPASPYFTAAPYPTHDVEKAKTLIREYLRDPKVRNRPREIVFSIMAPEAGTEYVSQLVQQWAEAGITAKINIVDFKDQVRLLVFGEYEAMNVRYFASADPDLLWHFFVDDTIASPISINFTRLRSQEITEGMNEGRASDDPAVRKEAYARVQLAFAQEMPYIWLQRWEWRVASIDRVRDARNMTLPEGQRAMPFLAGTFRLTETWVDR